MKTKEFIEKVRKLGFTIEYFKNPFSNVKSSDCDLITIYHEDRILVKVWTNCRYAISTISDGHSCFINGYDVEELYKLCFEYASTPVEDREDKEKKFYLKHRFLVEVGDCNYLNSDHSLREFYLNDKSQSEKIQTQFTLKEIEEIKQKLNTDLADFELVEVKNDN